jgi:Fe-S cluster biogenesis protein NfuA
MDLPQQIQSYLAQIRPLILNDGGDIQFVSFIDGIVSIKLLGACVTCPLSIYTVKLGIEERLKEHIPEVIAVKAV